MKVDQPVWLAIGVHLTLTLLMVQIGRAFTQGTIAYAQDDAYIHLAVAKNLALTGTWGPTAASFGGATSSLLWPLLLALFFSLTGPLAVWPALINLALIPLILFAFDALLKLVRPERLTTRVRSALLLAAGFLLPLAGLTMIGMEHLLHIWLTLLFLRQFLLELRGEGALARLLVTAGLATATRYESLFFVAAACLVLGWRRRWQPTLLLAAAGVIPVLLYAGYALGQGAHVLPNSLLVKGNLPDNIQPLTLLLFARATLVDLVRSGGLFLLLIVATGLAIRKLPLSTADGGLLALFALTSALQLLLARVSQVGNVWDFRYDAYLLAIALIVLVRLWPAEFKLPSAERGQCWLLGLVGAFILLAAFGERTLETIPLSVLGTKNIYEQHVQMGRFAGRYYLAETIVVADLGGVAFGGPYDVVDMNGLANQASLEAYRAPPPNMPKYLSLIETADASIAIIYTERHELAYGPIPEAWCLVGRWRIRQNVAAGHDTLSFYALKADEAPRLRDHLLDFAAALPPTVEFALHPDWR